MSKYDNSYTLITTGLYYASLPKGMNVNNEEIIKTIYTNRANEGLPFKAFASMNEQPMKYPPVSEKQSSHTFEPPKPL